MGLLTQVDALASSAHNMIKKVLGKPDQYICVVCKLTGFITRNAGRWAQFDDSDDTCSTQDVVISPNLQFGGNREPAAVVSPPFSSSVDVVV